MQRLTIIIACVCIIAAEPASGRTALPLQAGTYVVVGVPCESGSMATEVQLNRGILLIGGSSVDGLRATGKPGRFSGRLTWVRGERVNIPITINILNRTSFRTSGADFANMYRFCHS